jgi:hypothetical protein
MVLLRTGYLTKHDFVFWAKAHSIYATLFFIHELKPVAIKGV